MKEKEYFLIANADNTKFIGRDAASGGYPYETDLLSSAYIGSYDTIVSYYDAIMRKDRFLVKRIVLEEVSTD
jgi:hypothetical protein